MYGAVQMSDTSILNFPYLSGVEFANGATLFYRKYLELKNLDFNVKLVINYSRHQNEPVVVITKNFIYNTAESTLFDDIEEIPTLEINENIPVEDQDIEYVSDTVQGVENTLDIDAIIDSTTFPLLSEFTIEYHVVYSSTWKCPVLYFRIYNQDGSTLDLDMIKSFIIKNDGNLRMFHENLADTIGLQDHPYLNTPFYFIHPCKTHDLLKSVSDVSGEKQSPFQNPSGISIDAFISVYLSLVGPPVSLYLPLEFVV
ncbi:Ubiquitin-like-conjugating enzyme ATG10 [Zancudomyces culisetae]|uniref:Ubiquitin-like-conjugating enzyme ATG10 n=1 Tax=Zancudomyces culisetae TaxID=1213189 RepID=A0A1R1PR02_ZANCU|nr:Ubiquitin-like-conjugating enzyme ATG10 [Zancudomyces culisetae]|eukprot:OMH83384.1 Ubiquitin-like-conjugating enzyme ATG10 [Zancudomyces culisetae]